MHNIGTELIAHLDEIVERWYDAWLQRSTPHPEVSEAALKNDLPKQLLLIGRQLERLEEAEDPRRMWQDAKRLWPEARVEQEVPIEELVLEFELAVATVRDWLDERGIEVSFREYSYLFAAIFSLTAESVRRYAAHQTEVVRIARSHYLAGVMHQLRSPLAALSMQLEILDEPGAQLDDGGLERLQRNTKRLRVLVDGVLRLERYEPWEVPVAFEEVQVSTLVDEVMGEHEEQAAKKGLRFESRVDTSLRMTLDRNLFLDALGNLVHNAVKYTGEGFVRVESEEADESVVFHVRDSGPGIDPEKQKGLLEHSQPGRVGGAGIGLQIAQHAARAQGGSISFVSELGDGATFSLRLPREVGARDRGGDEGGDAGSGEGGK